MSPHDGIEINAPAMAEVTKGQSTTRIGMFVSLLMHIRLNGGMCTASRRELARDVLGVDYEALRACLDDWLIPGGHVIETAHGRKCMYHQGITLLPARQQKRIAAGTVGNPFAPKSMTTSAANDSGQLAENRALMAKFAKGNTQ